MLYGFDDIFFVALKSNLNYKFLLMGSLNYLRKKKFYFFLKKTQVSIRIFKLQRYMSLGVYPLLRYSTFHYFQCHLRKRDYINERILKQIK